MKPSERVPGAAMILARLAQKAGLPVIFIFHYFFFNIQFVFFCFCLNVFYFCVKIICVSKYNFTFTSTSTTNANNVYIISYSRTECFRSFTVGWIRLISYAMPPVLGPFPSSVGT